VTLALLACACLLLLSAAVASGKQAEAGNAEPKVEAAPDLVPRSWWLAERRKRKRLARYSVRMERSRNRLRRAMRYAVSHPPYGKSSEEVALLCIHFNPRVGHGEGAWDAHTGNGYENGLQMDRNFQRTYGSSYLRVLGPAWTWPVSVQLAVGILAVKSGRGYAPWPLTARSCGLL
jgi:hypothetical protein